LVIRPTVIRIGLAAGLIALAGLGVTVEAKSISQNVKSKHVSLDGLLIRAVRNNNLDAVRAIVRAGADVATPAANGQTALDIAIKDGHFDIANYLVLARRLQQREIEKQLWKSDLHVRAEMIVEKQPISPAKPPFWPAPGIKPFYSAIDEIKLPALIKVTASMKPAARVQDRIAGFISPGERAEKNARVDLARLLKGGNKSRHVEPTVKRAMRTMPLSNLRKSLVNVQLTLGESVSTGQAQWPRGMAEPNACVTKRRRDVVFCIVPVDWPRAIEGAFAINNVLYQGTRAIARYDGGRTNHYHTLFDTDSFDQIFAYLGLRYGPPTDVWKRIIAPFGKPRQPNPTYVWKSINSETGQVTILEIRKFDDARTIFPDLQHGALRLYVAGAPAVFPAITALDIMTIDWAARSDHIESPSPTLAKILRPGR